MKLVEPIVARHAELTEIRRDIHAHPELAFEESRTGDLVAGLLQQWGIEVHRGLARTGVVGVIHGRHGPGGRMVGLRADMDALPMSEHNQFAHASRHPGRMHACGHDGHTTMLLGAAQFLAAHRDFDGSVVLIFQPAEEFGGGAQVMLQEGLLEQFPVEAVFGMHNMPGIAAGSFALSPGPVLASNSEFKLRIQGKGGHAAMPHLAIDPIAVATQLIQAFQTIISRNKAPLEAAVISVTTLHAGDTFNVIPDHCELGGTVRAYTRETLDLIETRMGELAEGTAKAYGARCEFHFNRIYPSTVNHAAETVFAREVLQELVGPEQLIAQAPIMAAEDFSFMLEKIPGCYAFIGNGDGTHRLPGHGEGPCLVHNASYDFNDAVLPLGASYLVRLAERWLARPAGVGL
ncbi:amidohydrolase [Corticibacter populi]|uniref:Amidohydrolase n=1 Tax=Corticibacter populi TaxID=1550736 RepID=A0A3M6QZC4_9BURK|nr:M20 aminoacylase family protein [Corticibacter populi]RMX08360.1 amidohydrolase [Corticibacter populi]RZS35654.1 hippurate hydrolase [Corticibacter populi]